MRCPLRPGLLAGSGFLIVLNCKLIGGVRILHDALVTRARLGGARAGRAMPMRGPHDGMDTWTDAMCFAYAERICAVWRYEIIEKTDWNVLGEDH